MRVLVTTQVFPPEVHPTGVMVDQLAAYIAGRGDEAAVAAGYPHHPHGAVLGGYTKHLLLKERRNGYEVRRGWHWTSTDQRTLSRAIVMASQAIGTGLAGLTLSRRDVVVNFGPPLVGPVLSAVVAWFRRARFVPIIYDLYPDIAIETGKVRNPLVIGVARLLERFVYRRADRIVVLSEGFRRALVARGVPRSKIDIVPVWLDPDEITPSPRENAWRRENGIPDDAVVVLYAGTIGLVSGAHVVLDAAAELRGVRGALFVFVGEGRVKDEVEQEARRRGLDNVRFFPFQPRVRLNEVQATADISLVTLAAGRGRTSVPSKVVGYMAAGRPVVASVDLDSDTAEAVSAGRCGLVTPPGDAGALAAAVRRLLEDPALRQQMGRDARAYFESTYAKEAALSKLVGILEAARNPENQ